VRGSAEDRGDRSGWRRHQPALYPGAREGRSPLVLPSERAPSARCQRSHLMARRKKSGRRSVSTAPPSGGTRDRLPSRDRLKRHPQEGQHRAGAERGGTRDRVPPARDTLSRARDRSRMAETLRGSVHESPVRRLPHTRRKVSARKLNLSERRRSSRSTLSRGHFCADRRWNSWHGDARATAAIRKAILAPAKLTTFRASTPHKRTRIP
jgi:hypothetical protein